MSPHLARLLNTPKLTDRLIVLTKRLRFYPLLDNMTRKLHPA